MIRLQSLSTLFARTFLAALAAFASMFALAGDSVDAPTLAAAPSTTATPNTLPAPVAQLVAELPPRIKAPTDTAVFRHFVLDNGMRVLLVSDPRFNKSGAALAVNVGQIDDPKEREGLAHFLEHMLFLGTEKYPDIAEYSQFIKANGGYDNAYTTFDHTNYQFEVRHDAFPAALDRFAQFFIAPAFNADFTGREVTAVHNEAMRHAQNDVRRIFDVLRELYEPTSVESKFSVGNKDTLASADAAVVRAFYESHYSADRMALAMAGKASLDELEKLARDNFSMVPKRNIEWPVREAKFLPKKAALRLAQIEPVKELRQLLIEFPVPATRPDFLSHPDRLLSELLSTSNPGGLEAFLKREDLINNLNVGLWERTGQYGSMMVSVSLTPAGQAQYARVLSTIFSYLQFLRDSPFPSDYYAERSRVAQLNETYQDRGEGANLATRLAAQALFYPLEIAERAGTVWGKPDPAAYRRLLAALTPDNALVSLAAKGVVTNRRERIYSTAYSYSEDAGGPYKALLAPAKISAFALPGANPFTPAAANLLAERPLALVNTPALELYYAQDVEFQRPQTTLIYRFVPVREIASADSAALLRLYQQCLKDFLEPMAEEASRAGVSYGIDASLEGFRLSFTGFGDSSRRFADAVVSRLFDFEMTPDRYAAIKESSLRGLMSYAQTEAYVLARDRRDAFLREFYFLPTELAARTTTATWPEVKAFGRRFFSRGKIEALVHGHLRSDEALAATQSVALRIGAQPVAADLLLRRRHLDIPRPENVVDAAEINGVNSAFLRDYALADDSPATRATAAVVANYISSPFFDELRTRQQLGYIVGSSASASQRHRYLTFVVQSSMYPPDEVRNRAEKFIATLPASLAAIDDVTWATLVAGVRATFEEKPKSINEKAEIMFANAYLYEHDWERRQASLAALDTLTKEQAVAFLTSALAPATAKQRTVLLYTKAKPPAEAQPSAFSDRSAWKSTRHYQ